MKILNRFLFAIAWVASLAFTSCEVYLYDWEATPETEVVQIPQEGGVYQFDNFQSEFVGKTRFEPGEAYKHLRYRLILGGDVGKDVHTHGGTYINFEVPANENGAERRVTLELSKAKDFHMSLDECDVADLSEENWEEWQAVWFGVQAGR